ncbi:MAG: hypothetical protein VX589_19825, partial [Myxococcota bacterium]|nr:hypothetical protein [Myxococcota bacterium]
ALTPRMFVQRFNNLGCAEDGVGQTQEHVFHLRLAEDAELTIEVEGIFYGAVEVQPVCNSPNANNVCTRVGPGEDNQINRAPVFAGDYFVVVHSLPRQNPTIKVTYAYVP